VVAIPLPLDNVRSIGDLGVLMFIGEAERTTAELYEHLEWENSGRSLAHLRRFESLRLVSTSRAGRTLHWRLTDEGRDALRQLAQNITDSVAERT
jgi:DNA-binding MarR family transcriptional regulator